MKKYHIFKDPYILIEDIASKHQPFHKEYTTQPPQLNLKSQSGCPFTSKKISAKRKRKSVKQGFCETCYIKFEDYNEHILDIDHRDYARDNSNYIEVDTFIREIAVFESEESDNAPVSPLLRKTPGSFVEPNGNVSLMEFDFMKESFNTIVLSKASKDSSVSGDFEEIIVNDLDMALEDVFKSCDRY